MDFVGDPLISKGVVERRFDVKSDDRVVPALLWTPEGATGARPLVLIGHGGGGNKRMEYVLGLARRLVRHQGWAAAAIDGIGHGERSEVAEVGGAPGAGIPNDFLNLVRGAADAMVADWQATLARASRATRRRPRPARLLGPVDGHHVRRVVRGRHVRRPRRGPRSHGRV